MSVLIFTIFVSLALAVFFVGAFLYHHDFSGGDPLRDSLLPFRRETPKRGPSSPQPVSSCQKKAACSQACQGCSRTKLTQAASSGRPLPHDS